MATKDLAREAYAAFLQGETRESIATRYGKADRTVRRCSSWPAVLLRRAQALRCRASRHAIQEQDDLTPVVHQGTGAGHFLPGWDLPVLAGTTRDHCR